MAAAEQGQARRRDRGAAALRKEELDQILAQDRLVERKMVPDAYADLESAEQELAQLKARVKKDTALGYNDSKQRWTTIPA